MLEIIGLILLCNINKKNAVAAGKSTGRAIGLTLGLWIGLEILGFMIGAAAELGMGSYVLALVFAIAGGVASYFIVKKPSGRPNIPTGAPQYGSPPPYPPQSPQPPYQAGSFPQTAYAPQGSFCINCGNGLAPGIMFCSHCGMAVNTISGQVPAASVPVAPTAAVTPAMPVHTVIIPPVIPNQPPQAIKAKDCFYVFAVQGPAFGMAGAGDIVLEKAQKLKEEYEPAQSMELKIIRPNMWNARVQNSNTGGVISASYHFDAFKDEIRKYLTSENVGAEVIENGIKFCDEHSLQLTNPMSGVYVMGIPLIFEVRPSIQPQFPPAAATITPSVPLICSHEYRHFSCSKCGEKAPKPQLLSVGIRKENQYTYEDYSASTAEEARYFLEHTPVTAPFYYVMVHTPEGDWGKDKDSVFLSGLCDFQRNLSLRQCDGKTALVPEGMPDLQMAANGVTDNYLLSVTCGACGYSWTDGVGYRTITLVRCPDCGRYNLVDTEHIRFNNLQITEEGKNMACFLGHKWKGSKCEKCGKIREAKSVIKNVDYYALADKLAHFHTFSIDAPEIDQMEEELLSGGADALTAVLTYLLHCGQGKQSQGWWNNAKCLVRLIRRFPGEDHKNILTQLVNFPSNIYEFQTQVKNIAEEELKG